MEERGEKASAEVAAERKPRVRESFMINDGLTGVCWLVGWL